MLGRLLLSSCLLRWRFVYCAYGYPKCLLCYIFYSKYWGVYYTPPALSPSGLIFYYIYSLRFQRIMIYPKGAIGWRLNIIGNALDIRICGGLGYR